MPLVELKTDLKSLKFGKDRRGGGSSNQPYVQKSIPEGDMSDALLYGNGGPDFLLRGGTLFPTSVLKDEERISKYFIDTKTPRGLLFIANQNLLSRLAVKTEASYGPAYGSNTGALNEGIYSPLNTLAQIAGIGEGIHITKQGLEYILPLNLYYDVVKNKDTNENRLVNLFKFRVEESDGSPTLLEYSGGPGSKLGIGTTKIKFATDSRTGINNPQYIINNSVFLKGQFKSFITKESTEPQIKQYPVNPQILNSGAGALYNKLSQNKINNELAFPSIYKSGSLEIDSNVDVKGSQKHFYDPLTQSSNNGDLGSTRKSGGAYVNVGDDTSLDYVSPSTIDFIITFINNEDSSLESIYFPTFLDSVTDSYIADWRPEKMMGRGEDFYVYGGFTRELSFPFKVHAANRYNLDEMYNNLNKLLGVMTPDYSVGGFMRGNIVKISIGRYIDQLPGIITNLNFNLMTEGNWDTDFNTQLPQNIEVSSFIFKPIYNFLPNKNQKQIARTSISAGPRPRVQ